MDDSAIQLLSLVGAAPEAISIRALSNATTRTVMVADVAGKISFDANGLRESTEQGRELSATAIDSLEAIAFHLAAIRMNIQGQAHLPADLVHDYPRAVGAGLGRAGC